MFLHLGADTVIPLKSVIAITDLKTEKSAINDEFLNNEQRAKKIVDVSEGNAKTFVVTDQAIYFSAISSMTLKKRAGDLPEVLDE